MSEECAFYKYDGGYYCIKAKKNIDSDIVHRYCWGYHYGDCPIYKEEDNTSSCYITTACVVHKHLADDCAIMMNLRAFRDGYMNEHHQKDIQEYYDIAPVIVNCINTQKNSGDIWDSVYDEMIKPCNDYIIEKEFSKAYRLYKEKTLEFKERYMNK